MGLPTSSFDYDLPAGAIAQSAIEPRHSSRLLVTSTLEDRVFRDLPDLLDDGDLLVVNTTRVRRARLSTTRVDTGGSVEVLLLGEIADDTWQVMLRPARRIRAGARLVSDADETGAVVDIVVTSEPIAGVAEARISGDDVEATIDAIGVLPLPPYFHGSLAADDRYQTLFADRTGSAAAPTAALHFTDEVVSDLATRGVGLATVELDVGLDTFRPVAADDLADHEIHTERYSVPQATVEAIRRTHESGGRVIAVGTTVVRTLESAGATGEVRPGPGVADLFIVPGYRLSVVDALLTNFHAPRTTLIALVAALLGSGWRDIYATALERGYRFLSFGDAMFINEFDEAARRAS